LFVHGDLNKNLQYFMTSPHNLIYAYNIYLRHKNMQTILGYGVPYMPPLTL